MNAPVLTEREVVQYLCIVLEELIARSVASVEMATMGKRRTCCEEACNIPIVF